MMPDADECESPRRTGCGKLRSSVGGRTHADRERCRETCPPPSQTGRPSCSYLPRAQPHRLLGVDGPAVCKHLRQGKTASLVVGVVAGLEEGSAVVAAAFKSESSIHDPARAELWTGLQAAARRATVIVVELVELETVGNRSRGLSPLDVTGCCMRSKPAGLEGLIDAADAVAGSPPDLASAPFAQGRAWAPAGAALLLASSMGRRPG